MIDPGDRKQYGYYLQVDDPSRYDNDGPVFYKKYNIMHDPTKAKFKPEEWRGMRKGKLQLLYERGHVDPELKTVKGRWAADWGTGLQPKSKYEPTAEEHRNAKKTMEHASPSLC